MNEYMLAIQCDLHIHGTVAHMCMHIYANSTIV